VTLSEVEGERARDKKTKIYFTQSTQRKIQIGSSDEMDFMIINLSFQRHHEVMVRMLWHPGLWGGLSEVKTNSFVFIHDDSSS